MPDPRKLYLFVESFSTDKQEAFFEKELPYLCKNFQKVIIVPLYHAKNLPTFKETNIEVLSFDFFASCNRIKILLSNFLSLSKVFLFEIKRTHNKKFYFKNLPGLFNNLMLRMDASTRLAKLIGSDIKHSVFYTYWFNQSALVLSLVKEKNPELKLVTRVHGGDYDEEQVKTVIPFRYFQISKVNKILPVSSYAKKYLEKKFSVSGERIVVSRLGLELDEKLAPVNSGKLHLVSCSSVIPLKRVHLIAEIAKHINMPVQWTHFGSGPLLADLQKVASDIDSHVSVEFKGNIPNKEFIDYLRATPVSFVVNVSESEGIPVSLMEAIAFGIPVIGPDVCGVPELVNDRTGFLVPVNFAPATVAKQICDAHKQQNIYQASFRQGVQNFYKQNFFAEGNYSALARTISLT